MALLGSTVVFLCAAAPLAWSDTTAHVEAQASVQVDVAREPPFDAWCVKPVCSGPSSFTPLLQLPPILLPTLDYGLIEDRLHRTIAGALQNAANAAFGIGTIPEPVIDIARTAAAAVLGDAAALDRLGGLGASALRVALAYEMDGVLPRDPACIGVERIDALYEGLAISASLLPLRFPLKKGHVPAGCNEMAKRAARAVDAAVVGALVSAEMRANLEAMMRTISGVHASCGGIAGASEHLVSRWRAADESMRATSIDSMARSLRHLRAPTAPPTTATPPSDAMDASAPNAARTSGTVIDAGADASNAPAIEEVERMCAQALTALEMLDPASLEALADRGFAGASLDSLVQTFHVPVLPCNGAARCAQAERVLGILVRFAMGQANEGDLRAVMQDLALTLVDTAGISLPSPMLRDAIATLNKAVVIHAGVPTIDPTAIATLLAAKYEVNADGIPGLRALVGPSPWVFELNGGLPNVDFAQGKFVADASFGYSTKRAGIIGRGAIDEYDVSTASLHRDYAHYHGGLEGWWLSGGEPDGLQVELRLTGTFDYYDTTSYPLMPLDITRLFDFDSRIVRVAGFAGMHYGGPRSRIVFEARVGGGGQYEDPDTTTFPGAQLVLKSEANFSAHASGRAIFGWRAIPHILGLRLRGEGDYFDISRSDLTVTGATVTLSNQQQQQLEIRGRLFVDFDLASLAGFVPAAWGGLDYLGESGGNVDRFTLAAVVGIGIVLHPR